MPDTVTSLRYWFTVLVLSFCAQNSSGQGSFQLTKGATVAEIPFEYVNHFIIIEVYLNAVYPYKFIFDTGAEHTILTRKDFMGSPGMAFERTFYLVGSDQERMIPAHLVRGVRLDIPGKVACPRYDLLMLEENYFGFEEFTGIKVDGILSASVFENYVFRINYQKRVITLYTHKVHQQIIKRKEAQRIPIEITQRKPYMYAQLQVSADLPQASVKLLIDTGAATSLMLFTDSLIVPPVRAVPGQLAMGIGGYLSGFIGRVDQVRFGGFQQQQVVCNFQKVDSLEFKAYLNGRNGLLGNVVWTRFLIDLDYINQCMWLQPSIHFNRPYKYDRSGISLVTGGKFLNEYFVHYLLPQSPATEVGMQSGDQILFINRIPCGLLSIDTMNKFLRSKRRKTVLLTVKRGTERKRIRLPLRDLV